jgi:hypothetical protein
MRAVIYTKFRILQKSYMACGSTGGMVTPMGRTHGWHGMTIKTRQFRLATTTFLDSWNRAKAGWELTQRRLMILLK